MEGTSKDIITISLDAMGSDDAPVTEVAGAVETVNEIRDMNIILVGDSAGIDKELKKYSYDKKKIRVHHASEVIGMHDSPTEALKKKPDSSIRVGLELHKQKEADAFISSGNTGAIMAASLLTLGRIANVTRPTIGQEFPTDTGTSILFDVGANMDCKPVYLLEFALMGVIYANHLFNVENPRIALLNVGEEKTKGNALSIEAYERFEKSGLNFIGNIEGSEVLKGEAEVIVCDGFVGNVLMKFTESVPGVLKNKFKDYTKGSIFKKLWVGMMYGTLKKVLKGFDYEEFGGVPLLGVDGISIIGHGKSTAKAVKNMILKAEKMHRLKINDIIRDRIIDIKQFYSTN
ncbi:MAG: phosphate acyltransferase PlsX [Ignavibacteria bacterium]